MIPNSEALNWVIGPVTRAIEYVVEETKIADILCRSLTVLEGHEVLLRVARERFEEKGARVVLPKLTNFSLSTRIEPRSC
jgi:hypothetical protein